MTTARWPVTGENMSAAEYGDLMARVKFSGVDGSPSSTDLQPYRTPSGLFVRPGVALICGVFFEVAGADEDVTAQLVANATGSARYDLLTLRRDLATDDAPLLTYVVGGTSTAGPTPSYDPDGIFDVPLGVATVASGSTIPSSVTDARHFLGNDTVVCATVGSIPAARRRVGMFAFETSTGRVHVWTGSTWDRLMLRSDHTVQRQFTGTARAVEDGMVAGSASTLASLAIPAAPAGDWLVTGMGVVYGPEGGDGTFRLLAEGVSLCGDPRHDLRSSPSTFTAVGGYTHTGGTLDLALQYVPNPSGGFAAAGSVVKAFYLGPRS